MPIHDDAGKKKKSDEEKEEFVFALYAADVLK